MESRYWTNPRIGRRSLLRGAGALGIGAASAVLIGCGGDDEDVVSPAATAVATEAATAAPTEAAVSTPSTATVATAVADQVKRGGHFRWEINSDPPNFDMHANSTYRVNNPLSPVHNLLVQFDPFVAAEPPEAVIADLAESWTLEGNETVVFNLVENAKYHDGQPLTSADVKATFERIKNDSGDIISPRAANYAAVVSIDTPDDYTAVFNLSQPVPSLLALMAQGWNAIYSHQDMANDFDFQLEVNGTGPFRLDNYQRGNRFELSKNAEYHKADRPYLDKQTIFLIPEASTRVANFQSGELDLFRGPSPTDAKQMVEILGDKIVLDGPIPSYGFGSINFNSSKEPWNDNRVREAIAMSMNREAAIAAINQNEGFLGGYFNPSGGWASSLADVQAVPGYAPFGPNTVAEARKLLDAAGVADGYEATILTRQGNYYEGFSIYVQDQAKAIGIDMTLDVQETASAYDRLNTRNFDIVPWAHGYAVDDPDALFGEFYITGAARNYSEISTPEIDSLYEQQTVELDAERRLDLARQLEIAALGQYGKIITSWGATRELRWAYVKGKIKHASGYNNKRGEDIWLDL